MNEEHPADPSESEDEPRHGEDEAEREAQAEDPTSPARGFHDVEEAAGEEE